MARGELWLPLLRLSSGFLPASFWLSCGLKFSSGCSVLSSQGYLGLRCRGPVMVLPSFCRFPGVLLGVWFVCQEVVGALGESVSHPRSSICKPNFEIFSTTTNNTTSIVDLAPRPAQLLLSPRMRQNLPSPLPNQLASPLPRLRRLIHHLSHVFKKDQWRLFSSRAGTDSGDEAVQPGLVASVTSVVSEVVAEM